MRRFLCLVLLIFPVFASAQEPLKGPEIITYDGLKKRTNPIKVEGDEAKTEANRKVLGKQAKYLVGRLADIRRINADNLSVVIEEAINELITWRASPPKAFPQAQIEFNREMGRALVAEIKPLLEHSKPVVRMNAARMLSVVGDMGYDGAGVPALAILNKSDESDAIKFWALRTLTNLFGFEMDQAIKSQSCFGRDRDSRQLENQCIQFLCDYVMKPRDVANMSPEEIGGIRYLRREAIRALGNVRTPRLMYNQQTLAVPGLVLLKVAHKDGLVPEPDLKERYHAIEGFCSLFPVAPRADATMQCDYMAWMLAAAILDMTTVKVNVANNVDIPWRKAAADFEAGIAQLDKNAATMQMKQSSTIKSMYNQIKPDLLDPLVAASQGASPNATGFRNWLDGNKPRSKSLFSDDPNSAVKPAGGVKAE